MTEQPDDKKRVAPSAVLEPSKSAVPPKPLPTKPTVVTPREPERISMLAKP